MKKFIKTSIVAMAILAFGIIMINKSNAQTTSTTDVNLEVTEGALTITASGSINLGTVASPTVDTDLSGQFSADSFYVTDYKGSMSGYYTTIQVTDLTGDIGGTQYNIPAENVEFKAAAATPHLMTGNTNASVELGSISTTYTAIGSPVIYFNRADGTTPGILSQYGDTPSIKVTVPAFQAATTYHGVITYTLYEPGN